MCVAVAGRGWSVACRDGGTARPRTSSLRCSLTMTTAFVIPTTVKDGGKSHTQAGWKIQSRKSPICNAAEIEAMTSALGIAPPEMIFGNNSVSLTHEPTGWGIIFRAFDALDVVDKTGEAGILKVAHSEDWQRMREKVSEDIRNVVRPFDWTYSTAAKGRVFGDVVRVRVAALFFRCTYMTV